MVPIQIPPSTKHRQCGSNATIGFSPSKTKSNDTADCVERMPNIQLQSVSPCEMNGGFLLKLGVTERFNWSHFVVYCSLPVSYLYEEIAKWNKYHNTNEYRLTYCFILLKARTVVLVNILETYSANLLASIFNSVRFNV